MKDTGFAKTFLLSLMLVSLGVLAGQVSAQADCSQLGATFRPATMADAAVKNGQIPVGTCYDPKAIGISQEAEEAKAFLLTRYHQGGCSSRNASREEGISKLDSEFAISLAKMLHRAPMIIYLNSAYRSPAAQKCANPSVTASNHTKGCAVDLEFDQNSCNSAECKWVIQNSGADKLHIRMQYSPEWNHLEPTSCAGNSTGGAITTPNNSPGTYTPPSTVASLGQSLGKLFTPPAPSPAAQAMAQQPISAAQNPFSYTQPSAQPAATPASNLLTTGTVSNTGTVPSNPLVTSGGTISEINTNRPFNTNTTPAIDLIQSIAYPSSTIPTTATGSIVALNSALSNQVILKGVGQIVAASGTPSGTLSYAQQVQLNPGGQTFTSQDLKNNSVAAKTPVNPSTFGVLENLKQTLLLVLQWLKPFGGTAPRPVIAGPATASLK